MSKHNAISLAPKGCPWHSVLIGAVVIAVLMGAGRMLFPHASLGGIFIVSSLVGIGAFAASLG